MYKRAGQMYCNFIYISVTVKRILMMKVHFEKLTEIRKVNKIKNNIIYYEQQKEGLNPGDSFF